MAKDVMLIRTYKDKDGNEKSSWNVAGVCWGTNQDGSMNFELYHEPGVKYQIRDKKPKEQKDNSPF